MIFKQDNRNEKAYGLYGARRSDGSIHVGGDIDTTGNPTGMSTVDGYVEFAGSVGTSPTNQWGNHVRIFEGQYNSRRVVGKTKRHTFAHNKQNLVKAGQAVKKGQDIFILGKTGNAAYDSQAEHVHYQVDLWTAKGWVPQNPYPYAGIPNKVGTWNDTNNGGGQTQEDEDMFMGIFQRAEGAASSKLMWEGSALGYMKDGQLVQFTRRMKREVTQENLSPLRDEMAKEMSGGEILMITPN